MHMTFQIIIFIVLYIICIPIITLAIYILIGVINSVLLFIFNNQKDKEKALSFVVYLIDWPLMTIYRFGLQKTLSIILCFIWLCGFIVAAVAALSTTWAVYSMSGDAQVTISMTALWEALIIYFIYSLFGFLIASS